MAQKESGGLPTTSSETASSALSFRKLTRIASRALSAGLSISDATLILLATAAVLTALAGVIILAFPGDPAGAAKAAATELLVANLDMLKPEPHERYAYVGLTLTAPLVVGVLAWFLRRSGRSDEGRRDGLPLVLVIVAAVLCAIPTDPFRPVLFSGPGKAPVWLTASALFVVVALLVWTPRCSYSARSTARRLVTFGLCGLAVTTIAAWRVYGTASYAVDRSNFAHVEPVLYSIAQITLGATCLHDVLPQYGCYGEFLAPALRLTGLSVASVLVLMAALQATAMLAIIGFARSLIRDAAVLLTCGAWLVIVTNMIFWLQEGSQVYLQYWPLRILFPALSLPMVQRWQRHPGALRALGMGLFGAAALFWNLDSGVVVAGALAGFLLLSGITAAPWLGRRVRLNLAYLACYAGGLALFSGIFVAYLSWKAGSWVDVSVYTVFQKTFYISGFFLLPMPSLPDLWLVAACLALGPLILVALRVGRGPVSYRLERGAYLAILAAGVFSYFTGRSHPIVFVLVSWPFVILLFYLIDRSLPGRRPFLASLPWLAGRGVVGYGLVAALTLVLVTIPKVAQTSVKQWAEVFSTGQGGPIAADAAFIKEAMRPEETLGIMTINQAALITTVGRRSVIPGTGLVETIRRKDAEQAIAHIVERGPDHLFLSHELAFRRGEVWSGGEPWVRQSLDRIRTAYVFTGWGPSNDLMHLERRDRRPIANDLFSWTGYLTGTGDAEVDGLVFAAAWDPEKNALVGRWKQVIAFPYILPLAALPAAFSVELRVIPDAIQVPYASLISSHCCDQRGFVVHHVPFSKDKYVAIVGSGSAWRETAPFALAPGAESQVTIAFDGSRLRVSVNGTKVVDERDFGPMLQPPFVPVTLGGTNFSGRTFSGRVLEFKFFDRAKFVD